MKLKPSVKNAISIGTLCSVSYLAVYIARNVLSAVNPQIIAAGVFGSEEETTAFIGRVSSVYFITYAFGQLINGYIGDRIKTRYMISFGLALAGVTNLLFAKLAHTPMVALCSYAMTGFFLAMIYGPMTKVVAENTLPVYVTRCSLGFTVASLLGVPAASLAGMMFENWEYVFIVCGLLLMSMGVLCFLFFNSLFSIHQISILLFNGIKENNRTNKHYN